MNTIDFCYWLQGFFELSESNNLTENQVQKIRNHLNLVFKHEIDPLRESQTQIPASELNQIHSPENDPLVRC